MKSYHMVRLAAFVILERDNRILLARRFNTGYADGMYQMPSGHVEPDEYPVEAAAREALEEVGVTIPLENLESVHTSYRINKNSDGAGDYVDFFFRATNWEGEPTNQEPEKCDEIIWATWDKLPMNINPVVREVLGYIREGKSFSEVGRP